MNDNMNNSKLNSIGSNKEIISTERDERSLSINEQMLINDRYSSAHKINKMIYLPKVGRVTEMKVKLSPNMMGTNGNGGFNNNIN